MADKACALFLTPAARQDLDDIFAYMAGSLGAPGAAHQWMARMEAALLRLADFPLSGGIPQDATLANKGYRRLVVDRYLAFYRVDQEARRVVVMRVLYGGMDYGRIRML